MKQRISLAQQHLNQQYRIVPSAGGIIEHFHNTCRCLNVSMTGPNYNLFLHLIDLKNKILKVTRLC